jgi:hypothetical protein
LNTVFKYGQAPTWDAVSYTANISSNEMLDAGFGAETTRRVQVRWRIRYSPGVNSTAGSTAPSQKGFVLDSGDQNPNPLVFAQGGRVTCAFTVGATSTSTLTINTINSGYVALGMVLVGPGIPTGTTITSFITGSSSSGGTYGLSGNVTTTANQVIYGFFLNTKTFYRSSSTASSVADFAVDNDQNLYIAGDGICF